MTSERFEFLWHLVAISIVTINSQDAALSGLLPTSRCWDTMITDQFFACKLDSCKEWITFHTCPDGSVSTGQLNLQQKGLICQHLTGTVNNTDIMQELLPHTKCTESFMQFEVFWCSYENCWFAFSGCDENETQTEFLNFNLLRFHCLPKQTTTEDTKIISDPPTSAQQSFSFSGDISLNKHSVNMLTVILFMVLIHWLIR